MQMNLTISLINTINIIITKDLMNSICLQIMFAISLRLSGYFILFCRRLGQPPTTSSWKIAKIQGL
jgi:hypothetical protein